MNGKLDIPEAGGWAKPPATAVADPAWRRRDRRRFRWAFWLGGLALVSLAGAVAMQLLGGLPQDGDEAPLISADPTPVRVRPDDPGGMRVANLDKAVYDQLSRAAVPRSGGGEGTGQRVESLLPPPEAPKPVPVAPPALPAQRASLAESETPREQATPAERAAAQPEAGTAPRSGQAPPPPAASSPPVTPPSPQPSAQPATSSQAAAAPPGGTGSIQVQLAAVPTEAAAQAEWERLRRRMPDLLGPLRPSISRGERDGQPFFRLRAGGFATNAEARSFCDQVRARGGSCFVAPAG
ncbi:SPOR domain-containing protein [Elioraea tepida]|jgi:hypothetical protein|uniref:SPOR domain-containing protein n=1 Tax=Elioraea tepida TaxID=2843330 RepID=A0A975U209_9PROT|nr:SPOR domain-containing protein [Elioraea tepida]QXM24946.1 SPOR domain-containing protein [Elioraea tepida]